MTVPVTELQIVVLVLLECAMPADSRAIRHIVRDFAPIPKLTDLWEYIFGSNSVEVSI